MTIKYRTLILLALAAVLALIALAARAEIRQPTGTTTALCYTVSNATAARIADAFAWANNYQATVGGVTNPESKAAFTDRILAEHIRQTVRRYETVKAREAAEAVEAAKPAITVQ